MKPSKKLISLCFLFLSKIAFGEDTTQVVMPGRQNAEAQAKKPYVILISADGFRYDLAKKYKAKTLLQLSKQGVTADFLQPSFPSLTFPNHYTIATGMYPSHHGLVDNNIYDPKTNSYYSIGNRTAVRDSSWYGGVPLWVLAEQNQMLSACFYWVGSESAELGVRPTYYFNYSEKIGIDSRIAQVKNWLQLPEEKRPHLITFYLPEVDHAEHKFGPDSKETEDAVHFVDECIRKMTVELESLNLNINFVFVADHGMTTVDTKNPIILTDVIDTNKFKIAAGSTLIHLYAKNATDIESTYQSLKADAKGYDVYSAKDIPTTWHYGQKDDSYHRIGDIVLVAQSPRVFTTGKYPPPNGQHGYDPTITDMRAIFYAWGPAFKRKKKIAGFENIHIYPLIAKILGLDFTHPIDGDLSVLQGILR